MGYMTPLASSDALHAQLPRRTTIKFNSAFCTDVSRTIVREVLLSIEKFYGHIKKLITWTNLEQMISKKKSKLKSNSWHLLIICCVQISNFQNHPYESTVITRNAIFPLLSTKQRWLNIQINKKINISNLGANTNITVAF